MRSMDPEPADLRYADRSPPGPVLLCRRAPCWGAVYHDQETHDFLRHGGHPPATGQDPLDVTTHADYAADPVRRASAPPPYRHATEQADWFAHRVLALLLVGLVVVMIITIYLAAQRTPAS